MADHSNAATDGFTGVPSSVTYDASAISSIKQSLASVASVASGRSGATAATASPQTTATGASASNSNQASTRTTESSTSRTTASSATKTSPISSELPSTLSTSTISSISNSPALASTTGQTPSTTASNAAANTSAGVTVTEKCDSVSCNHGYQAAIAVPIVLVALSLIGLCIFLARRRRRRPMSPPPPINEKAKPKKKWSRHLRVFSFGEELLMGGRFSSTTSLRTGDTGSMRSGERHGGGAQDGSIHSVEEVAPPYRDTVSQAVRPAGAADPFPRPSSSATAPPPYADAGIAAAGRTSRNANDRPTTPTSSRSRNDPFRDTESNPVSPIEEDSPFNDPDDDDPHSPRPLMRSRPSSLLGRALSDIQSETSTLHESDAGSIRQATLVRNVSMSGARTVDVTRNGSQRGSNHS